MNKYALTIATVMMLPSLAFADGRDLATKNITELPALTGTSAASGDLIPLYDTSAATMKKVDLGANLGVLAGVTASAAEINYNDITTAGTVQASKAVVVDANKDAASFRNLGLTGTLTVNSVAQPLIRYAFDAVASGQTSKTTTMTGVTASSRCVAALAEVATNSISLRAAVPGTNEVVVTVSGDPGASNQDYTVLCMN